MPLSNATRRRPPADPLLDENQRFYSQAVRACLARLQRAIDLLQQPLLSEVQLASLHRDLDHQTRRLNAVLRHLLPAASLARPTGPTAPEFQPVDLLPVLAGMLQEYQALIPDMEFTLRPMAAPVVDAAAVPAMRLVAQLLLDNAVRRGPGGRAIQVTAQAATDGQDWAFHFHDDGASLPAAHLATLFDDPGRAGTGAVYGLGLSLAGFLVGALGGRLWACSASGQGATFSFSLPSQAGSRRWTVSRPKVLLIEDDAVLREALRAGYEDAGFEVRTAETAEAGVDLLPGLAPTLVLLELSPAALTSVARFGQAAVIFLVAPSEREAVADALWQGASDCLVKPFHMRELIARTRAILRRRPAAAPPTPPLTDRLRLGLPPRPKTSPLLQ